MKYPKVLSTKQIFQTKLFQVNEIQLEFPNGKQVIHHQIERVPTVTVFPITEKYEIYLVSEYRLMFGKTILSACAGHVDKPHETPLAAAKRELEEELGITANQWEALTKIEVASSVFHSQSHIFLAKDLTIGIPKPEEDEQIERVKLPLAKAVTKVLTGEITTAATVAGILLLDTLRRDKRL